jgi:2-haloalkanoic acid dehalogenase type II
MTGRGVFVFFDLGETLVDLTDLVGRIADRLRREIPGMEQDAERTSHDWIRRTSASLPRAEGAPFVREIDVAATVLRELLASRGIPITESGADELLRRAWSDFEPNVRFCPGVSREWLEEVQGLAAGLGVVTDGDIVNVNRLVKRLDLERYFRTIVTSEAVRAYKPNPRIYRAALEALGAAPRNSVFVSDTPLDLQGAAAVGMRTALLPRGLLTESAMLPSGAVRLSSPQELRDVLENWSRERSDLE